jgi:ribosomal protein L18E
MAPISTPSEFTALFGMVADDERSALERLLVGASLRSALDHHLAELAQCAREEEGHSWADVGKALEISKQAAQQRFGKVDAIRVDLDGAVVPSELREEQLEELRVKLSQLDMSRQATAANLDAMAQRVRDAGDDDQRMELHPVFVEVEVPVEVEVEVEVAADPDRS